ncbi:MAG: Fic family protein [Fimbriimonadaceae bacterium]|nr:Fic family protein [Fimbriimonadaceae bacterium]
MHRPGQTRSGTFLKQPTGYVAFMPHPLPPNSPELIWDDELRTLLSRADRALGRLDGATENLPNPGFFVAMYIRQEAVLSSQIEGTQSSLADVLEREQEIYSPNQPKDAGEVLNYLSAMNYGLQRLDTLPISLRLVKEIHERLVAGVRGAHQTPGAFRTSQNWIGPAGATLQTAQFVPPPPDRLLEALGAWEDFVHQEGELPALIKIGLLHAQFETIHPFLVGNGRVGRMLITFLLVAEGILAQPILYLSLFLKRNRTEYYDRLQRVRTHGEWEPWLKFFLAGMADTANDSAEKARTIIRMREEHRSLLAEDRSAALKVLEWSFEHPVFTIPAVSRDLRLAADTVRRAVAKLEAHDLLSTGPRTSSGTVFRYTPLMDLFADPAP